MNNNVQQISEKNRIQISFKEKEDNRKEKTLYIIGNIFVSGLLYLAVVLSLISMFNIQYISVIAVVSGFILIFVMNYFSDNLKILLILSIILTLFLIGLLVFQKEYIKNGLFLTVNQIINVVGTHTGFFISQYEITVVPELYQISTTYFGSLFCLIIAFVCFITVKNKSNLLLWVFILPIFILEVFIEITPGFFHNMILFFAGILLANYSFINDVNENKLFGKSKNSMILSIAFMAFLLFIVFSLILTTAKPASSYSKNSIAVDIKSALENKIEDFRYEKGKTNTFTQGNFRRLGKLELLDSEALEVVMDKPTSLYLRGYVGSDYTKEGWTDLDSSVYYDSYGLFYWLHQSKFNGLNQLSLVNDLKKDSIDKDEKINITVNNINANSKQLYIPYELDTELDHIENIRTFDDSKLMSTSFYGERLYKYKSNTNLVKKYPELASDLYDMKDDPKIKEYFKNESHYNEFVYENYTKISKDIKSLIENQLGKAPKTEDTHIPYEKAIEIVKSYLSENIKYTVEPKSVPKGKDFLKHFLENSREGYATHYATAATAMFRYLEIPSRYVEGYLITPKDVENVSESETINIKGTNAHAWTEIYIDELGWLPIEVTPPYYDVMEKTETSKYPSGGNLESDKDSNPSSSSPQGKQEIIDDEQKPHNKPKEKTKRRLTTLEKVIIITVSMLLMAILAYIIYVIKKRRELQRIKKGFEDSDYKVAVPRIFAYSMFLLHYDGLPIKGGSTYGYIEDLEKKYSKEYAKIFVDATKINQEAVFSNHEISEKKYDYMRRFMNQILYDLVESKNIFRRIKMKFWDFIY